LRDKSYCVTAPTVILRSRASGVSKDGANIGASWFETTRSRLLTMTP